MLKRQIVGALIVVGLMAPVVAARGQTPSEAQLTAATEAFNRSREAYISLDYEEAERRLNEWLVRYAMPPYPPDRHKLIISAYELRARTRERMQRPDEARADFRQILLYLDPGYQLSADVGSQTVRSMFEEVRRNAVGTVDVLVTPADAQVTVNGQPIPAQSPSLSLPGGSYKLLATRAGHRQASQEFTVVPGTAPLKVVLPLERVSSNATFVTSPAGVEVIVDGVPHGKTEVDPKPASEKTAVSRPYVVTDLASGRRTFEFNLACHQSVKQVIEITQPDDLPVVSVALKPAMARLRVSSANAPAAAVYVDDESKGALPARAGEPLVLDSICQGPHTLEVRSEHGRDLKRYDDLKAGQEETFVATVRPAFAIVSDSLASAGVRGGRDFRRSAEEEFRETTRLLLFSADQAKMTAFFTEKGLPLDWLKFSALREKLDGAKTIGDQFRRESGVTLSRSLGAQGIAAVAREPLGDQDDMLLILLARGSAIPDVIRWRRGDRQRTAEAIARLDATPALLRSSIGLTPIDVMDVPGAVVASVEAGGSAEGAGIKPGDIISVAAGASVKDAAHVLDIVAAQPSGPLTLEVRGQADAGRKVDVTVLKVPNLVSLDDQSLLSNRLAAHYTAQVAEVSQPLDQVSVRLDLAVVLMRLDNHTEAVAELDRVVKMVEDGRVLPSLTDVVMGTTQYLLGVCAEKLRNFAAAEQAFKRAAQARGNLLTEDGEPLKELAAQKLAQLASSRGDR